MIGKLVFKLPEEREDFEIAQNGWKYKIMWEELCNNIRNRDKYENKESITHEELRNMMNEIHNDYTDV